MCKIITVLNNKPENADLINKILEINADKLSWEKDGYAVYSNNGPGATRGYVGDKSYEAIGENIKYKGGTVHIIHSRTMTSGERGVEGLHLQKLGGRYVYAHNGAASGMAFTKTKSDSHHFFAKWVEKNKPSFGYLKKLINDNNFWGRGFLYDELTDELHIFANSVLYTYAFNDCLLFSSYPLTLSFEKKEIVEEMGLYMRLPDKTIEIKPRAEAEYTDVYFKFKKNKLEEHKVVPSVYYKGKTDMTGTLMELDY